MAVKLAKAGVLRSAGSPMVRGHRSKHHSSPELVAGPPGLLYFKTLPRTHGHSLPVLPSSLEATWKERASEQKL